MPKKGPKSQRIIYRPCSKSGPICALTLSHTAHYLGRYAQKHELKRATRITIEQCCGTHGLGLCRRYWPFCWWTHLVKVVYMPSKILKLTVVLRDLSQAEKINYFCSNQFTKWQLFSLMKTLTVVKIVVIYETFFSFGFWYFCHFNYVIFFPFFSVLPILPCKI